MKKPLQRPYNGPYKVLETGDKFFKILVNGKTEVISIDRLKAAVVETSSEVSKAPNVTDQSTTKSTQQPVAIKSDANNNNNEPTRTTRSGCRVRFPSKYCT